uniref:Ovule protein n=1 Tax=Panagrolaimus sp. JU765 TaxID=591449 RepID=A0AC34QHQ7_9BILA
MSCIPCLCLGRFKYKNFLPTKSTTKPHYVDSFNYSLKLHFFSYNLGAYNPANFIALSKFKLSIMLIIMV